MQKITPFLWFDSNAEEAMNFYTSIFPDSKIGYTSRYNKGAAEVSGRPEGSLMTASFELCGQEFMVLNGGPEFKFTEAVSFMVRCKDQEEVDFYWNKLVEGGEESQCGWLKDKFGLSWQIVPDALGQYLGGSDPAGAGRAMQAMLKMKKLIVEDLKNAYEGK
jgi:predicted 3-demethylubiquinone-9 3-methyltransferase (glyoxalase superfamily)